MKARVLESGFVIVFLLMLTAPLVCINLYSDRSSEKENRMLANPPQLDDIKEHPKVFIREFDAWFKDSVGFREQAIGLYNVVYNNGLLNGRYKVGQDVYLVGQEGHHYWASENGNLIPRYQGKAVFSNKQLRDFAVHLDAIRDYLSKKNIPFIVMFCADKETIYPEYYPRSIKYGGEPVQLDVITKYLQNNTSVDVFNIRQALWAEKNKYPLFPKTEIRSDLAHYNEIAGFFAYRELMKHISNYFPDITSFTTDDVTIAVDNEGIAAVSLKEKKAYERLDDTFFDGVTIESVSEWATTAFESKNITQPVILFLRDSFVEEKYVSKYIAQQFGRTIMIHYRSMKHWEEYVTKFNPDMVVFESAEWHIEEFFYLVTAFRLP
jgi:hypothetical protein